MKPEKVVCVDILVEKKPLTHLSSCNIARSADHCIELPIDIGSGTSYWLDLDTQTKLMLTEVAFNQAVTFDSDKETMCGVFILLEGELTLTIEDQAPVDVDKGTMAIFFLGDSKCRCRYSAKNTKMINFSISEDLMALLAQQSKITPVVQDEKGAWHLQNNLWTMPIIPEISVIIKQIYESQLPKTANKIYLQAKVVETLTLAFNWYQQQGAQFKGLTSADFERILAAAQIVEQRMSNPLSLTELAHQVGINDNKLKKQFKMVFNQTVFEYLGEKRMEQAKYYFLNSELNVNQVAQKIGLKHLGHFSAQFKKSYLLTPNQFIKKYRCFKMSA